MDILRSPLHYKTNKEAPFEQTEALRFGTILHAYVLEPDEYLRRAVKAPKVDRRTTVGKETWAKFQTTVGPESLVIMPNDEPVLAGIQRSIDAHPLARELLGRGEKELSGYWVCKHTGVLCRIQPDNRRPGDGIVIDLKSTDDASAQAVEKAVFNYNYDVQGSYYLDGCNFIEGGHHTWYDTFAWVFCEKEPPYAVAVYEADSSVLQVGRQKYEKALRTYAQCLQTNEWPGYKQEARTIYAPEWAKFIRD